MDFGDKDVSEQRHKENVTPNFKKDKEWDQGNYKLCLQMNYKLHYTVNYRNYRLTIFILMSELTGTS